MIKSFSVTGLNRKMDFSQNFHPDINIITGKNGSGKTTLLKLVWYMASGSLSRVMREIQFKNAKLETDEFTLSVTRTSEQSPPKRVEIRDSFDWTFTAHKQDLAPITTTTPGQRPESAPMPPQVRRIGLYASQMGASVFFPTFRRIEGGFSMATPTTYEPGAFEGRFEYHIDHREVTGAFFRLSDNLSSPLHRFVASISTNDIVSMLTKRYAEISESINRDNTNRSREITKHIDLYQLAKTNQSAPSEKLDAATKILEQVQKLVNAHKEHQELLLRPFTALSELIARIFQHKGIQLTSNLTLGQASEAISSDSLSAGEKQMLSFLTYNAFASEHSIFIDEPEISLHVDWQRTLFPTLLSQGTHNQFIVATHSPFIYSKYADKELVLDADRGGE